MQSHVIGARTPFDVLPFQNHVLNFLLNLNFTIRFIIIIQLQDFEGCRGPSPAGIIHALTKCHRPSARPPAPVRRGRRETGRFRTQGSREEGRDALNDRERTGFGSDSGKFNPEITAQHSAERQMAEKCKMQRQAKVTYGLLYLPTQMRTWVQTPLALPMAARVKSNHSAGGGGGPHGLPAGPPPLE